MAGPAGELAGMVAVAVALAAGSVATLIAGGSDVAALLNVIVVVAGPTTLGADMANLPAMLDIEDIPVGLAKVSGLRSESVMRIVVVLVEVVVIVVVG